MDDSIDKIARKIINTNKKSTFTENDESTLELLYKCVGMMILCILKNQKKDFSHFAAYLLKYKEKLPQHFSIQFSYPQVIMLIMIGSRKFNDFHLISDNLEKILNYKLQYYFINKEYEKYSNYGLDSVKGPLPFMAFLIEINSLHIELWIDQFQKYINNINYVEKLYKNHDSLPVNEKNIFPNGYIDISRSHGLCGLISLIIKILTKNHSFTISNNILYQLIEIIESSKIDQKNIFLWTPYLIFNDKNDLSNEININTALTQKYCWCSGSFGMNKSIKEFANYFGFKSIIEHCEKIENIDSNIILKSNDYHICHGYAGVYMMLKSFENTPKNKIMLDRLKKGLKKYISKATYTKINDYSIIDGNISSLIALYLCEEENVETHELLTVFFMQD